MIATASPPLPATGAAAVCTSCSSPTGVTNAQANAEHKCSSNCVALKPPTGCYLTTGLLCSASDFAGVVTRRAWKSLKRSVVESGCAGKSGGSSVGISATTGGLQSWEEHREAGRRETGGGSLAQAGCSRISRHIIMRACWQGSSRSAGGPRCGMAAWAAPTEVGAQQGDDSFVWRL